MTETVSPTTQPFSMEAFDTRFENLLAQEHEAHKAYMIHQRTISDDVMAAFFQIMRVGKAKDLMLLPVPHAYWQRALQQESEPVGPKDSALHWLKTGLPLEGVFDTVVEIFREQRNISHSTWTMRNVLMSLREYHFTGALLVPASPVETCYRERESENPYACLLPLTGNMPFVCQCNDGNLSNSGWFVVLPQVRHLGSYIHAGRTLHVWGSQDRETALAFALQLAEDVISLHQAYRAPRRGQITIARGMNVLKALLPQDVTQL